MSSIRQQLIDGVVVALGQIQPANGYQTSVGAHVFAWRKYELSPAELPALLVCDTTLTRDIQVIGSVDNVLTIEVVAVVEGAPSASQARLMEADLIRCMEGFNLAAIVPDWGVLKVAKSTLEMEQHEQMVAAVSLTAELSYRTDINQS